jgi:glutamine amidotransferase
MILIIDYGMGNIRSVHNALNYLNLEAKISSEPEEILKADRVILPGVGAFGDCMKGLIEKGVIDAVKEFIDKGKPFLGICVGMQLLFERSFEFGEQKGLGYFDGDVKRFDNDGLHKVPHMGWNNILLVNDHPLVRGITNDSFFYFVHSYYAPVVNETVVECNYINRFSAMVVKGNIAGVQFHPEKSQKNGLHFLKNFGEWKC